MQYRLAAYYFAMKRGDYLNQNGKGKWVLFVEEDKVDDVAAEAVIGDIGD